MPISTYTIATAPSIMRITFSRLLNYWEITVVRLMRDQQKTPENPCG